MSSKIEGLPLLTYLSLTLMSLERNARVDKGEAKEDLKELDRLLKESHKQTYSNPADLQSLQSYANAVVRYKKQLE